MVRHDSTASRMDQASRLRWLVQGRQIPEATPQRSTHILAVASGKGGVGKTFVAANLSIALAARRHRVLLFDMDLGLANADIILGVEPTFTWMDVLAGRRDLDEVVLSVAGGVDFVPGFNGPSGAANLSEFERHQLLLAMQRIEQSYDLIVLDCGAGISRNVLGLAGSADTVLIVTSPEPTALTDGYAMIKAFAQDRAWESRGQGSVGVIVNQAASRQEGRETYERLAGVAARFLHLPVNDYGYILSDEHVPMAVRARRPVLLGHPRCPASSCLMAVAGRVARDLGVPEARPSLFHRVMSLFV